MAGTSQVLPPGTLLQLRYLRARLARLTPGRFIEIGPGAGEITARLLAAGWSGTAYDLSPETVAKLRTRFASEITAGRLIVEEADFVSTPVRGDADLVISCMVMEHLDSADEATFMQHAAQQLRAGGRIIALVPASMEHWGIEDDIAGHFRRYERETLQALCAQNGWMLQHLAGLTVPVSNLLLPVSNWLVKRNEAAKLDLSMVERTKHSGRRQVRFKTEFPSLLKWILNETTMAPLDWLQRAFSGARCAMVLYMEAVPQRNSGAV